MVTATYATGEIQDTSIQMMIKLTKIFLLIVLCLLFCLNLFIAAIFIAMLFQSSPNQSSFSTFFEVFFVFIISPLVTLISLSLPILHHRMTKIGIFYYLAPLFIFLGLTQSFLLHGVPRASLLISLVIVLASAIYFYFFKVKIINDYNNLPRNKRRGM